MSVADKGAPVSNAQRLKDDPEKLANPRQRIEAGDREQANLGQWRISSGCIHRNRRPGGTAGFPKSARLATLIEPSVMPRPVSNNGSSPAPD